MKETAMETEASRPAAVLAVAVEVVHHLMESDEDNKRDRGPSALDTSNLTQ